MTRQRAEEIVNRSRYFSRTYGPERGVALQEVIDIVLIATTEQRKVDADKAEKVYHREFNAVPDAKSDGFAVAKEIARAIEETDEHPD